MRDIFGRKPSDYAHLRDIAEAGGMQTLDSVLREQARSTTGTPSHNFNLLPDTPGKLTKPLATFDAADPAQAIGFVTNNLQAIQTTVEEILYVDFRLDEFLPIETAIPEGAATYAYRVTDKVGEGKFIERGGDDTPPAGVSQRLVAYRLEYAGIMPQWTLEDIRAAAYMGYPLDRETVEAATTGAMNHIEQVGLLGDTDQGFQGFLNHNQATPVDVTSAMLPNTDGIVNNSAANVLRFLQARVADLIDSTNEIFGRRIRRGLTIYLPVLAADFVKSTPRSTTSDTSIWEYFVEHNLWYEETNERIPMKIVPELKGILSSDVRGSSDRMILGFNDKKIGEMAMPFGPRVIRTLDAGYVIKVPMEYKISGYNLKRPAGLRYINGV